MKKEVLYEYLGTNGTILSPIHLEDIYYVRKLRLIADKGYILRNKNNNFLKETIIIPENNFDQWEEIERLGQE